VTRPAVAILVAVFATSCDPITPTPGPSAPINACPDHPCEEYMQPGAPPECNGGVCLVTAQLGPLVVVVSLPQDSYFAPSRTFAVSFSDLVSASSSDPICAPGTWSTNVMGTCARLPDLGVPLGAYTVTPSDAQRLNFALNPQGIQTTLPVVVTYRPRWPLGSPTAGDATALGLPLQPVETTSIANQLILGPALGPGFEFQSYLQHGYYERTVAPQAPFDRVFPPDVRVVEVAPGSLPQFAPDPMSIDNTRRTGSPERVIPTFDLTRAAGLDGWMALLRDQTTKRPISNIVPLNGTTDTNVVLATNHSPVDLDALTNAELVLAPPAGEPIPTGVFQPTGTPPASELPRPETYLPLPPPALVQGTLAGPNGTPVEGDLVFEATGIDVATPDIKLFPAGNLTNFEYVANASARRDPTGAVVDGGGSGDDGGGDGAAPSDAKSSNYSVRLPRGQYRVTIRPVDSVAFAGGGLVGPQPQTPSFEVTVVDSFVVPPDAETLTMPLTVTLQQLVRGKALLTDLRPLAQASVDALPLQCARGSSKSCLPRVGLPTTTADDGTFSLMLDEGMYVLRVRPLDGTGLPWVWQVLVVGPAPAAAPPPLKIPAPVYAGLTLHDPQDNPIVSAIVRVFQMTPPQGAAPGSTPLPAVEIGRSITDANGHYDMYIAPAAP
jgi:hypothetical protein